MEELATICRKINLHLIGSLTLKKLKIFWWIDTIERVLSDNFINKVIDFIGIQSLFK